MSFKNKVVLITGGSSGIGAAAAILFSKEGADVTIVARNESKLSNVAVECVKFGKQPLVIKADVSKDGKSIVEKTINKYGKLDVLVNNAGIVRRDSIEDENIIEIFDEIMSVNLRSVIVITNAAVPHLKKTKGCIINISSICSKKPVTRSISYAVSKAALDHFTKCTALALAEFGVRVNTVQPGPVITDIIENSGLPTSYDEWAAMTALGKSAEAEEIAEAIIYLAGDSAKSITGSTITMDNGFNLK